MKKDYIAGNILEKINNMGILENELKQIREKKELIEKEENQKLKELDSIKTSIANSLRPSNYITECYTKNKHKHYSKICTIKEAIYPINDETMTDDKIQKMKFWFEKNKQEMTPVNVVAYFGLDNERYEKSHRSLVYVWIKKAKQLKNYYEPNNEIPIHNYEDIIKETNIE